MSQLENIEAIEKRLLSAADTLRANSNYAGRAWCFCGTPTAVILENRDSDHYY